MLPMRGIACYLTKGVCKMFIAVAATTVSHCCLQLLAQIAAAAIRQLYLQCIIYAAASTGLDHTHLPVQLLRLRCVIAALLLYSSNV
jgi:hypothetical protein